MYEPACMQITPYKLRTLTPPQDDLRAAIRGTHVRLGEGDIVAISSKVVSIGEGRCVPLDEVDKLALTKREADYYLLPVRSKWRRIFTIAGGALVGSAGIDESNADSHYVLYPENPQQSARALRAWLKKEYGLKRLGVIITDSTSMPLRRGAIGFALAWSGFKPLRDYRGTKDLFGRVFTIEIANLADGLAAAANIAMGEGGERTPLVVIHGAPGITFTDSDKEPKGTELRVEPADDLFAPLLFSGRRWKPGKAKGARK